MKRTLPPYVYRQKNGLYFQRRDWPTRKFCEQDETSPGFFSEYAQVLRGDFLNNEKKPKQYTFTILINDYISSPRYRKLARRTVQDYDKVLTFLKERIGKLDPRKMQRMHVVRLRDNNAKRVRFANYCVQVIRIVFEHAIDIGWVKANPAAGVALLESNTEARHPWPEDLLEAFRDCAGPRDRLLFELLLGTGQRISDVLKMKWSCIEADGICVKQGKTGKDLWIPMVPELQAIINATERKSIYIVTSYQNRQLSYRSAAQAFRKIRSKIGAEKYDIHCLRYTAASKLVEAGCSDEMVAAITGQSLAMVIHYTKLARQRVRAKAAIHKLNTNKILQKK